MVNKIELRVHAGAPSSRRDDDRYRALTDAYLGFTGQTVTQGDDGGPARFEAQPYAYIPERSSPHDGAIDGSTTIRRYDETTYVEDTQLAYNALESQLQTSSLTIPEITPLKRRLPDDSSDTSPWPEDLDRHSPPVQRPSPGLGGPSQLPDDPFPSEPLSPEVHRLSKKSRLERRVPIAPVFKPFQPPLRRPVSAAGRATTPEARVGSQNGQPRKSPSIQSFSQSSYLKTPVLITPARAPHFDHMKPTTSTLHLQRAAESPARNGAGNGSTRIDDGVGEQIGAGLNVLTDLPDYRERTPNQKPLVPYTAFREGSRVGLAFIGDQPHTETPGQQSAQRQSQLSGSAPDTTSELPTTYSLSDITPESSRAHLRNSQRSTSEPGPLIGSTENLHEGQGSARSSSQPAKLGNATSADVDLEPANRAPRFELERKADRRDDQERLAGSKPPATALAVFESSPVQMPMVPPEVVVPYASAPGPPLPSDPGALSFNDLPITIRPPEPAVSTDSFISHITEGLRWLAETSELKDHYNPVSVTRTVRALERGYWRVNTRSWPRQLQSNFWHFLENMVGSGHAGWGIWCLREPADEEQSAIGKADAALGRVKLFCWGEVVKHVYLMLYVASKSKVRKAGLQWIDSEEKVVVQMRRAGA